MPQVDAPLIDRLIAAFDPERGALIVVPTIDGKRGNPVALVAPVLRRSFGARRRRRRAPPDRPLSRSRGRGAGQRRGGACRCRHARGADRRQGRDRARVNCRAQAEPGRRAPGFPHTASRLILVRKRQYGLHQRIVQTGRAARRSHRRSAISFASMIDQLRAASRHASSHRSAGPRRRIGWSKHKQARSHNERTQNGFHLTPRTRCQQLSHTPFRRPIDPFCRRSHVCDRSMDHCLVLGAVSLYGVSPIPDFAIPAHAEAARKAALANLKATASGAACANAAQRWRPTAANLAVPHWPSLGVRTRGQRAASRFRRRSAA